MLRLAVVERTSQDAADIVIETDCGVSFDYHLQLELEREVVYRPSVKWKKSLHKINRLHHNLFSNN